MKETRFCHILSSPNKNYLGHQDLPHGKNCILTIQTFREEEVINPTVKGDDPRKKQIKKIIRWEENPSWIKPMICNVENARAINMGVKIPNIYDYENYCVKVELKVAEITHKKEKLSCLRVERAWLDQEGLKVKKQKFIKQISDILKAKLKGKDGEITLESIAKSSKVKDLFDLDIITLKGIITQLNVLKERQEKSN